MYSADASLRCGGSVAAGWSWAYDAFALVGSSPATAAAAGTEGIINCGGAGGGAAGCGAGAGAAYPAPYADSEGGGAGAYDASPYAGDTGAAAGAYSYAGVGCGCCCDCAYAPYAPTTGAAASYDGGASGGGGGGTNADGGGGAYASDSRAAAAAAAFAAAVLGVSTVSSTRGTMNVVGAVFSGVNVGVGSRGGVVAARCDAAYASCA